MGVNASGTLKRMLPALLKTLSVTTILSCLLQSAYYKISKSFLKLPKGSVDLKVKAQICSAPLAEGLGFGSLASNVLL